MSERACALALSARDDAGLRALAAAWATWLRGEGAASSLEDLCRTAALGRATRALRACPVGTSHAQLAAACDALAAGEGGRSAGAPRELVLGAIDDPVALLALAWDELAFAEAAIARARGTPAVLALLAGARGEAPARALVEPVARAGAEALLRSWSGDGDASISINVPTPGDEPARTVVLRAAAAAWCEGAALRWDVVLGPGQGRAPAPTTPWQRRRLPLPVATAPVGRAAEPSVRQGDDRPALGWILGALARVTGARPGADAVLADLGVDSLMALEVTELARIERGVELPLRALAPDATAAALASALASAAPATDAAATAVTLDADHASEPFALTDVQRAYWLGRQDEYALGGVACHWYGEWELGTHVSLEQLERAIDELVARHPMLRAVIAPDGRQRVLENPGRFRIRRDIRDPDELAPALSHRVADHTRWPLFCVAAAEPRGGTRRLALSFDLLIADGASLVLLGRELDALVEGRSLDAPPALSFRDYLHAERTAAPATAACEYWRQRIPSLPDAPQLPLAVAPEQLRATRFAREREALDSARWQSLKQRAARAGLTPSGMLCAAYAETLALHAKDPRFLLNVTTYDRRRLHPDIDRVVGDFTSLTLLEVDGTGMQAFADRARSLRDRLYDDLEHRAFGGVAVLRERARHLGTATGAPVVFTSLLGHTSGRPAPFAALGEPVRQLSQTPQVWLDHQVTERDGELELTFDHVEQLFPAGFVAAMATRHRELLVRLADDPEAWTNATFPRLEPAELRERNAVNATTVVREPELLPASLLRHAAERPADVAVITDDGRLTFGELDARSATAARWLADHGVHPNRLVAIVMPKCAEQAIAAVATTRAGAAYLPIDAALPPERIRLLLREGQACAVLTTAAAARSVPSGVPVLRVDEMTAGTSDRVDSPARTNDLAYVIFTSGSTGTPKGVMIEHGAAHNTIADCNARFRVRRDDRVFGISSLSFDLSVWDLFGVVGAGGALVLPRDEGVADPGEWARLAASAGVTIWNSVPAIAGLLEDHLAVRDAALPPDLRLFMLSGDWIPLSLPDRLRARAAARLDVVSLGGATEAAIWSIAHRIGEPEPGWTSVPYGRPLENQTVHVLDSRGRERPDWVPGDLHIGGVGLARGYWRDGEKTSRAFVRARDGRRLYRTGDLARWRPGGLVEFLGREDGQVKINGYRVELGEVEAALADHPHVAESVVRLLDRRLVGYVVAAPGVTVDIDSVQSRAAERLPRYMVPAVIQAIPQVPLTANGKVDRSALPDPLAGGVEDGGDLDAQVAELDPADDRPFAGLGDALQALSSRMSAPPDAPALLTALLARRIRAHVALALGVAADRVDPGAAFSALGVDSLAAIELRDRIEAALGIRIALERFAGAISPRALAAELASAAAERAGAGADTSALAATLRALRGRRGVAADPDPHGPFPLTDVQQAYWVGRNPSFSLGGVACHFYGEFEGREVDPLRLQRALDRLVARHPMLSASVDVDGRQSVPARPVTARLEVGAGERTLLKWREELDHRVADPAKPPLWTVRLVRLADGVCRTLVSFDLLIADGTSLFLIGADLDRLYVDPDAVLPEPRVSFRQCVLHETPSEARTAAHAYWRERAAELPDGPRLALARAPHDLGVPRFRRLQAELPATATAALRARSAERGLSPSVVLCAAYAEALATRAAQPDFTLAVTTGDRPAIHPDVGAIVGDFTSVTPLAVHVGEPRTFYEAACALRDQLWQDLEHRSVSAVALARERARAAGRPPASWPVVFTSLLGQATGDQPDPLHSLGRMVHAISQTPQVWIDHQAIELEGRLLLAWDVIDGLFADDVLQPLFDSYVEAVRALAADDAMWDAPRVPSRPSQAAPAAGARRRRPPPSVPSAEPVSDGAAPDGAAPDGAAPDGAAPDRAAPDRAAPAESAARVGEIVADVLGCGPIDTTATFVELGADSLQLVRILNRIEAEIGARPLVDEELLALPVGALLSRLRGGEAQR